MTAFANKVVWITGASSGIGEELAYQLNEQGARLVLSSRRESELKRVAEKCSDALVLPLDLGELNNAEELTREVLAQYGAIDYLINNGGNSQRATAFDTNMEVVRSIVEVNFFGAVNLTKAVLPQMRKQGSGHIVVVSSITGKFGFYLRSSYAAAKHALHGYFDSLRLEEEHNGLKVTIACPGKIKTNVSVNAVTADGSTHGVMDRSQGEGMPSADCARALI
jgi:dehydrogenase/reductase SDR family protein 7B